jgi:hypothetical protein
MAEINYFLIGIITCLPDSPVVAWRDCQAGCVAGFAKINVSFLSNHWLALPKRTSGCQDRQNR